VTFRFEHGFSKPRDAVFALHEDPAALARLLGRSRTFRLVGHDGHIRPGSITWIRDRLGLLPVTMALEHFLYEPPFRFGERLVHGPFRAFEHVHEFSREGDSTLVRDTVTVTLPWYLGGELAVRAIVGPKLRAHFRERYAALGRLLAGSGTEPASGQGDGVASA
jgi:ligand-binding SRPBCC domain-containing protein